MSEESEIRYLLSLLTEKTKAKIMKALDWARSYELEKPKENYNSRQIAALVFFYESVKPSWDIGETLCNMDTAERNLMVPWLRDAFGFNKSDVYDAFTAWMKNGSTFGSELAYVLSRKYEIPQEAAYNGDNEKLEWLLKRNVDVDFKDSYRDTALHIAAKHGKRSTVKLLLEHGASMFLLNSQLHTPFDLALDAEHYDICDILFSKATRNFKTEAMITDLVKNGNFRQLRYILKKNNWVYFPRALLLAVEYGRPNIVNDLLGICPNTLPLKIEYNKKILNLAIESKNNIILDMLLGAGFRPDASQREIVNEYFRLPGDKPFEDTVE